MIIVKLMGGLGNQMFQYAFGRYLSVKHNTNLKLDLSFLNHRAKDISYTLRSFELGIFPIQAEIASPEEVNRYASMHKNNWKRWINAMLPANKQKHFIIEKQSAFYPEAMTIPDNSYLQGYWQSEKYFASIRNMLLAEFKFTAPLNEKNTALISSINTADAIALHVRRGDYVQDKKTADFHGTCSIDYYQRAIELLTKEIKKPVFFLFSDDMTWVKNHLSIPFPVCYVDHNQGANNFEDMRLMSLCKHQIVANSSFSWWAAWLNTYADKKVIAPVGWFNDPSIESDIVPVSWIKC